MGLGILGLEMRVGVVLGCWEWMRGVERALDCGRRNGGPAGDLSS